MNQIENLHILFNGNNTETLKALNNKANWINHKFVIPGNLETSTDKNGKEHYEFLEALLDGCFIFEDINLNLPEFNKKENELINTTLKDMARLIVYSDIDDKIKTPFWVEYDFNKLEMNQYYQLFPNFYNALPLRILNVNLAGKNLVYECVKCAIAGETFQNSIILSKNDLFNLRYHCPVISKIYVEKDIDPELLETLNMIAKKYEVEVEELEDE